MSDLKIPEFVNRTLSIEIMNLIKIQSSTIFEEKLSR